MKSKQRGLSLIGFLFIGALVVFAAFLAIKTFGTVVEYLTIKKAISAVAGDSSNATVGDVRKAFDRRALIDDINSVRGADLDVAKVGGKIVIGVAYERRIELFGPVSLCLDFQTSSAGADNP